MRPHCVHSTCGITSPFNIVSINNLYLIRYVIRVSFRWYVHHSTRSINRRRRRRRRWRWRRLRLRWCQRRHVNALTEAITLFPHINHASTYVRTARGSSNVSQMSRYAAGNAQNLSLETQKLSSLLLAHQTFVYSSLSSYSLPKSVPTYFFTLFGCIQKLNGWTKWFLSGNWYRRTDFPDRKRCRWAKPHKVQNNKNWFGKSFCLPTKTMQHFVACGLYSAESKVISIRQSTTTSNFQR